MRITNNIILILIVLMIIVSLFLQIITLNRISDLNGTEKPKITGESINQGKMSICLNNPPVLEGHNCTKPLITDYKGLILYDYSCYINVSDHNNNNIEFRLVDPRNEMITSNGILHISGTIVDESEEIPENIIIIIFATDDSGCNNDNLEIILNIEIEVDYGHVMLIQNYPSNTTNIMELSEGYTTFHKPLDDYFIDTLGYPLDYEKEFSSISCFSLDIKIDNETSLSSYTAPIGSSTEQTGPCIMKYKAFNPFNQKNETNIFEVHIKRSELSGESKTAGASGSGGGSSAGSAVTRTINPKDCVLKNVSCTPWSDCLFNEKNQTFMALITYNMTNDGIKTRNCEWMTNCPGELEPSQREVCDYLPNCNDGMKNCHEIGDKLFCEEDIDCGGPCEPCPTCFDNIKNQGEAGIDCGGPCEPCPTCYDEIMNCHKREDGTILCEEGIDCGGPCASCPNCSDKIKNCHRMEDRTILCETGIDCGGPCPKCIYEEMPLPKHDSRILDLLLIMIIFGGLLLSIYTGAPRVWRYYQLKYIEFIKNRILKEREYLQTHYIEHFENQIEVLKNDFDLEGQSKTKNEGDKFITTGSATGYNIDRYSVSFDNDYADIITDNSVMSITYSMYLKNIKHGKRVLAEITKLGIKTNYKISKRSSSVLWDQKWVPDPDATYEQVNGKWIARTIEYNLTFFPKDEEEAKSILKILEIYGKGKKMKIEGSWDIPDIRITGTQDILDYEKRIVNTKSVDGQKLVILTKNKPIPGFKDTTILINPALAEFIK